MAIQKRKSLPPPSSPSADFSRSEEADRKTARNVALQGQHLDVYRFVESNEPCTREDVSRGLGLKSSTATARIKELIDEGYLFEPGDRKLNRSGVRAKVLRTSSRPQGGKPNDRVRVEVILTIDSSGHYGATAYVVGGLKQLGPTHNIAKSYTTIVAPHPDTYRDVFSAAVEPTRMRRTEVEAFADDIIEGTAVSLDD